MIMVPSKPNTPQNMMLIIKQPTPIAFNSFRYNHTIFRFHFCSNTRDKSHFIYINKVNYFLLMKSFIQTPNILNGKIHKNDDVEGLPALRRLFLEIT